MDSRAAGLQVREVDRCCQRRGCHMRGGTGACPTIRPLACRHPPRRLALNTHTTRGAFTVACTHLPPLYCACMAVCRRPVGPSHDSSTAACDRTTHMGPSLTPTPNPMLPRHAVQAPPCPSQPAGRSSRRQHAAAAAAALAAALPAVAAWAAAAATAAATAAAAAAHGHHRRPGR